MMMMMRIYYEKMDFVIGKVTKSIPSRQIYLTSVTTGIQ